MAIDALPVGKPLGRIPVWYLGILPLDYDAMTLVEVVPGFHFHEVSTMRFMRRWEHRRVLVAVNGGERTKVTDTLEFEPRLPIGGRVIERIFRVLFAHRHRRLVGFFERQK